MAHLTKDFHLRDFFKNKSDSKEHFWILHNDFLGINPDNSFDDGLEFRRKSWPTGDKCDIKNIKSDMDCMEKIYQVFYQEYRSFEAFINANSMNPSIKRQDFWIDCGLDYWDYVGWLWFYSYRIYTCISGWILFQNYWKYYNRLTKDLSVVW